MQHELSSNKNLKLIKLFKCWREWKMWAKKKTHNSLFTNKKNNEEKRPWSPLNQNGFSVWIQRKMKHSIPFLVRTEANTSPIETFSDITRKRLVGLIGQVIHKWSNKILLNKKWWKIKYRMVLLVLAWGYWALGIRYDCQVWMKLLFELNVERDYWICMQQGQFMEFKMENIHFSNNIFHLDFIPKPKDFEYIIIIPMVLLLIYLNPDSSFQHII